MILWFVFWGAFFIILDLAFFPVIFSYSVLVDFSFFYFLSLSLIMKEKIFLLGFIFALFKSLFLFYELALLYSFVFLSFIVFAYLFRKAISQLQYVWNMIWGLSFIILQILYFNRFSFSEGFYAIMIHLLFWSILSPLFFNFFTRKVKLIAFRKGSVV